MGVQSSKPARAAPVRYVARVLPRHTTVEDIFKKKDFTAKGINDNTENINTEPTYYTETERDENSTQVTESVTPRWYLNTFMEMMDGARQDRVIITGNLPIAWERDKFEPYALVRNRVDEEDLKWILSAENKKIPLEQLRESTKLESHVLQDILDSVELPRQQFRNYKGKLTKAIPDSNEFLAARKDQAQRSKELEKLKAIGYSPEEIAKDEQYLTNRSRGVKTLDELGVSHRSKQTSARVKQAEEMEQLLEERRVQEHESGRSTVTKEMLEKPADFADRRPANRFEKRDRSDSDRALMYARKAQVKGNYNLAKIHWWLESSRRISRASDKIHGVPTHNKNLQMDKRQFDEMTLQAVDRAIALAQGQNVNDPRSGLDGATAMFRAASKRMGDSSVEVFEGDEELPLQHQFAHTRHHKKREEERSIYDTPEGDFPEVEVEVGEKVVKDEKFEKDINAWLRTKYRGMESARKQILTEMEVEVRASGKDWDESRIPLSLREPIFLDDEGNRIKPPQPEAPNAAQSSNQAPSPPQQQPPPSSEGGSDGKTQ
jgi:hypothetical protein